MDMSRAAVNPLGNCLATAVIARTEGVSLKARFEAEEETPVLLPEVAILEPALND